MMFCSACLQVMTALSLCWICTCSTAASWCLLLSSCCSGHHIKITTCTFINFCFHNKWSQPPKVINLSCDMYVGCLYIAIMFNII